MELSDSILELDRTLAVVLAVVVGGLLIGDLKNGALRFASARNVTLLTIFFWYLLEALLLSREVRIYPQRAYNWAMVLLWAGTASFLCGYYMTPGKLFNDFGRRLEQLDRPQVVWKILCISLAIGFLPLIVLSHFDLWEIFASAFRFGKRWSGSFTRGRYGGVQSAFLELRMFLKAAIPVAVVVAVDARQSGFRRSVSAIFILWMFMTALSTWTALGTIAGDPACLRRDLFSSTPASTVAVALLGRSRIGLDRSLVVGLLGRKPRQTGDDTHDRSRGRIHRL